MAETQGPRLAGVRFLAWGRPRLEVAPGTGAEASPAMERSLAMRWMRALGVTSVVGGRLTGFGGGGFGGEVRVRFSGGEGEGGLWLVW